MGVQGGEGGGGGEEAEGCESWDDKRVSLSPSVLDLWAIGLIVMEEGISWTQFETFFTSKEVDSSDLDDQVLKERFQKYTSKELQTFRRELLYYMDALEINIDRRALHESEWQMKKREGIALDVGLDSEASTDNNTSTEHQNGSSNSGYAIDTERARVDKVVFDKENVVVGPSLDNNTLTKQETNQRESVIPWDPDAALKRNV
ncbi:hypothetical protein Tco_0651831 [Tanacetum coccineum]|uniref:Uncharacterized protein n=1 Tax=Tanacetum coccineum TaxID=301880 RepID=A0ABQ4WVW6_9ASTR